MNHKRNVVNKNKSLSVSLSGPASSPRDFQKHKFFFHVKLGNIKFLHVNNMGNYSLFIEQDLSDKKYLALSEFVALAVN